MPSAHRFRSDPPPSTSHTRLTGLGRLVAAGGSAHSSSTPVGTDDWPPIGAADPVEDVLDAPGPTDPAPVRSWRTRFDAGRPGTLLLCAVALVAAVVAGVTTWWGRPDVEPVPVAPVVASGPSSAADPVAEPSAPVTIVVAVVGQVATPGLVTLPEGSRVADAVAAAGGALPDADLTSVNLARVLTDGEQVAVGVPGAPDPPPAHGTTGGLIDLNTAAESELDELPGVGPVLAGRIVEWRTENGGFDSVEQLQDVDGIGPSTYDDLRDLVTV